MPRLPTPIITRILQHLPTASIFTASLVCSSWRKLLFTSGPPSQALLKPHLAVLRHHFGEARVPHKMPIAALRKLLVQYARRELFGEFSSTASYNLSSSVQLSQFALSASLLAIVARNGKILLFDLQRIPLRLLAAIKSPGKRVVALALSEAFLAILDEAGKVHLYHLLARDTPNFLPLHTFSVAVPALRDPAAIAITQEGGTPPLIAVLGGEQLHLLHPAHALSEKRRHFFRDTDEKAGSAEKAIASTNEWILTAPTPGFTAPIAFGMYGRHISDGSAYLGSAWSNESSAELARRRIYGLKDGQDIATRPHDADALFRHYRGGGKWGALKRLDTGEVEVEDALHLWDAFYILTESATGLVRIVSVAPFEHRCSLYRRGEDRSSGKHCGYAVWAGLKEGKRAPGSYVVFSPAEGRLKILPLHRIPWNRKPSGDDAGWELLAQCRDVAIGAGEILGLVAGPSRVLVLFVDRVVVVRLWTRKVGGVEDEEGAAWAVGKGGAVHREGKGGRTNCMGLDKGDCAVM
jgi:hypothetical protein